MCSAVVFQWPGRCPSWRLQNRSPEAKTTSKNTPSIARSILFHTHFRTFYLSYNGFRSSDHHPHDAFGVHWRYRGFACFRIKSFVRFLRAFCASDTLRDLYHGYVAYLVSILVLFRHYRYVLKTLNLAQCALNWGSNANRKQISRIFDT
jgi:hypothetical protein